MDSNQNNVQAQQNDMLNIQEILLMCVTRWYWFLLSVAVCLGIGLFMTLRTQPKFSRDAQILIKETSNKRSSSDLEAILSQNSFAPSSKIVNEKYSFLSPKLMQEVVKRLDLNVQYSNFGRFHKNVIYGSQTPVKVSFLDVPEKAYVSMTIDTQDGASFRIKDFVKVEGKNKLKVRDEIAGCIGDTLNTAAGRIVVEKSPYYEGVWDYPVAVNRRSVASTTNAFLANFQASPVDTKGQSDILGISMVDVNPSRADDLLSMLITVYNENWVADRNRMAISTSLFIKDRLDSIEKELGSVDEDISKYKSRNLIPDVSSVSNMYMQQSSEATRQLQSLENELYVTRFVRNYLTSAQSQNQMIPMGGSIENSGISSQISEYNRILLERNNIVANSSERNPLVVDLDAQLASMRQSIITSVNTQEKTLEVQMDYIRKQDQKTTASIAASPDQAKDLLSYERQQTVKETLYLFLLQKREENELSQAFTAYNTMIIKNPTGSDVPISPKRNQILLISLILGLCIPLGIIYLQEMLNTKVRGKKDIDALSVPFLGEVPQYATGEKKSKCKLPFLKEVKKNSTPSCRPVVVKEGKRDVINEAFRVLRTNLEFMTRDKGSSVIMVTSFNVGSGKTFLTMNTALALAIKGKKVVVVDGDLRHASTSAYVSSPKVGVSDYLAGKTDDFKAHLIRFEGRNNLEVLPVGQIPPNPAELVGSDRFVAMIAELRKDYDYIFIDCPPRDIVADSQIIEANVDRTIFVVRAGLLERAMLPDIESMYHTETGKNMCIVLNGTESAESHYGKRYGYRYGYKYGYRYGYGAYGKEGYYHSDND